MAILNERLTPIFSTESNVSLIPAVSINLNSIPLIINDSSMVSLVVPGISETIALSSLMMLLSKVDFPAFGLPTITTGTPFLIAFP